MSEHPQTIQIFLPSGDPQGIRTAAITTRIVQVIEIPRVRLEAFLAMPEAGFVGVYVLFGENEQTSAPMAYVGQTGNLGTRLKQHNEKKDFWNRAVVALSLTQSLTLTHAYYLEWLSITRAAKAQRFELDNGTIGTKPHTPPAMEAECREIFETFDILLTTLGYPLFDPLIRARVVQTPIITPQDTYNPVASEDVEQEFYCRASGVNGRARYTEEGLVVLAGSYGRTEVSEAFLKNGYYQKRQDLIDQGVLKVEGGRVIYTRDTLYKSPSSTAAYLLGRSANGWSEWKNSVGVSLGEAMGRYGATEESVVE
ncbi:GIY-YIG nuclease family protein [Gluconobacter cerinus]|uniref:GIY-YIG nuclease family protein n=1 Tax=Gluconobacter cerinus TaxID=38307 RepID=UPI003AB5D67B